MDEIDSSDCACLLACSCIFGVSLMKVVPTTKEM